MNTKKKSGGHFPTSALALSYNGDQSATMNMDGNMKMESELSDIRIH
jgi:hypothetical protein